MAETPVIFENSDGDKFYFSEYQNTATGYGDVYLPVIPIEVQTLTNASWLGTSAGYVQGYKLGEQKISINLTFNLVNQRCKQHLQYFLSDKLGNGSRYFYIHFPEELKIVWLDTVSGDYHTNDKFANKIWLDAGLEYDKKMAARMLNQPTINRRFTIERWDVSFDLIQYFEMS